MPIPAASQDAEPKVAAPWFARRRTWLFLFVFGSAASAIFGLFLYRYQWRGGVAEIVTKALPYPAAIVEGRVIRYSDFQDELSALRRFYDAERDRAPSGSAFPDEAELKRRVLDRLVKDTLAEALASRYGIVVTAEDVAARYDATVIDQSALASPNGKAKAEARAADTLRQMYGLRPSQFKTDILRPSLIRQKLEKAIQDDEALNAENRKKAEKALSELKSGKAFKDVALAYSEAADVGTTLGDRGEIGRGLLAPEVETAAFGLSPGETSGVVKSPFGYHVLRVTERQEQGGKVTKVHLYEILVRPIRLDDYLEARKKTASIILFIH